MADDFLRLFNSELVYFSERVKDFAQIHPEVASQLRISDNGVEDPHVERLIQAVAFLNARTRFKIEDDFPELTDTLLEVLYPHYLKPIPSMSIVQFTGQSDLEEPVHLEANTPLQTSGPEPVRYRTCYPVELWPITLEAASLSGTILHTPANASAIGHGALACLWLSLSCRSPQMTFTQLAPRTLRFYLRGERHEIFPLYELIFNHTVSIALADSPGDTEPLILKPGSIQPVGFLSSEGMLPYPSRSFLGYRLLTEYFIFPEKFFFFDLDLSLGEHAKTIGRSLDIIIYLNRTDSEIERRVTAETFALGCTPVVNLFRQRAAPIRFSGEQTEYAVEPDVRRRHAFEVYTIDSVTASSSDGMVKTLDPLYAHRHTGPLNPQPWFWHATRRQDEALEDWSTVFLSVVNSNDDSFAPVNWTLSVETTCTNRRVVGNVQPRLEMIEQPPTIRQVSCLRPLTRPLRIPKRDRMHWQLMSHLLLNHLSLSSDDIATGRVESSPQRHLETETKSASVLREMLRLYDFTGSDPTQSITQTIRSVRYQRGIARVSGPLMGTFCHGIDIDLEFQAEHLSQKGVYLFTCVLDMFFGLYCSINSFTRLTTRLQNEQEAWKVWPPRTGDRPLL